MITRRNFLTRAGVAAGGAAFLTKVASVEADESAMAATSPHEISTRSANRRTDDKPLAPGQPGVDYTPVVTPNGAALPWRIVGGVKVYHLIAEEVEHEFAPGLKAFCWGYNGRVHGPTIEAVEGDRVRIYVTNKLPAATTTHWHGVILPNGMDGVGGLNQPAIKPGETFKYEFTLRQHSTNMYHSHHDEMTQMAMGLMGMFIIHPRQPRVRADREFAILLSEWRVDVGTHRPNPNEMLDFNLLTMNARIFPGTDAMVVKRGERVRIRLGNLSAMDHHPIHLHGHEFKIVGSEASDSDEETIRHERLEGTVLVPVGQTRTIEFIADNPGDWAMHCHMTHHVMNQMGHKFPNMIGVKPPDDDKIRKTLLPGYMTMGTEGMADMGAMGMSVPPNSLAMVGAQGPFDYITMGGMFNILKVRESLTSYDDPGWYQHPPGEVAALASAEELQRDGIAAADPGGKAASARKFACPMHPEVVDDKASKCPKCGMTLVAQ